MASFEKTFKLLLDADTRGAVTGLDKLGVAAKKAEASTVSAGTKVKSVAGDIDHLGVAAGKAAPTNGLLGGLTAQATKAEAALTGTTKRFEKLGDGLTKVGVGGLAFAGVIGYGLVKAGQAASDLNESVNAVQVTFGKASSGVQKLGQDAATSMGLSNTAFNSLAVQFSAFATTVAGKGGDVVSTLKDLTGRAADFGSVMNIDVADAARLFQSGLAGETEPLRKFGIDLSAASVSAFAASHGIGTLGQQLSEGEKIQARYGSLMEQTSKVQGDFANTSDSAANATRIAKAEFDNAAASLGASVAPALAFAAEKAAGLAKGFAGLNEATGGFVAKAAGVVAIGAGVVGGLSLIVGQGLKLVDTFSRVKSVLTDAEGGLSGVGKAAKGTAVAIGTIGAAVLALETLDTLTQNTGKARKAMDEFIVTAHGARGALGETALTFNALLDLTYQLESSKGLKSQAWDGLKNGLGHVELSASATAIRLGELKDAIAKVADTSPEALQQVIDTLGALEGQAATGDEAAAKMLQTYGLTASVVDELTKSNGTAAAAQDILSKAITETGAATDGAATATVDYKEQAAKMAEAVGKNLDDIQFKWDTLRGTVTDDQSWLHLQQQFDDTKQAGVDAFVDIDARVKELKKSGVSTQDAIAQATAEATKAQRDSKLSIDDTKAAVIDYGQKILGIPLSRVTEMTAQLDAGNLQKVQDQLEILTRNRTVNIDIIAKGGAGYGSIVGVRAAGGPVQKGMPYLVGENRQAELFVPEQDGRIVPLSAAGIPRTTMPVGPATRPDVTGPISVDPVTAITGDMTAARKLARGRPDVTGTIDASQSAVATRLGPVWQDPNTGVYPGSHERPKAWTTAEPEGSTIRAHRIDENYYEGGPNYAMAARQSGGNLAKFRELTGLPDRWASPSPSPLAQRRLDDDRLSRYATDPIPGPAGGRIGDERTGHNTYNVVINVPPGADLAAVGKAAVEAIKVYERSNGARWRAA